jgi:hypothetical protein
LHCGDLTSFDLAAFADDLNLTHNTNLRYICLDCGWLNHSSPYPHDWLFALFSQVISPLEHVRLEFHIEVIADLDVVDWTRIEREFTQQRWANLQKFTIQLWGTLDHRSEGYESIKLRLPVLDGRGVLQV